MYNIHVYFIACVWGHPLDAKEYITVALLEIHVYVKC